MTIFRLKMNTMDGIERALANADYFLHTKTMYANITVTDVPKDMSDANMMREVADNLAALSIPYTFVGTRIVSRLPDTDNTDVCVVSVIIESHPPTL